LIRELARTAWVGSVVTGLTSTLCPLIVALAGKDEYAPDPVIRAWANGILLAAGVRDHLEGLEHMPQRTSVYVCNHQSHFDALLILGRLPRHIRFVAKAELFKVPVFGAAMAAAGNVKVDRAGGSHDRHAMAEAIEAVRERTNILFFAEGTRSEDGLMKAFKRGAATLALQAGVPLVPMAVAGTKDILTKGTLRVRGGQKAALCVGEAIQTEGLAIDHRDELTERVREAVVALYARAQGVVDASAR
jgi:1-acyl-sn-glycerol-3-phosphate acyltransferase